MRLHYRRFFSVSKLVRGPIPKTRLPLIISDEVRAALNDKLQPVISLESTIITHGLPYDNNLSMAQEVEQVIRNNGGVPATCAFIDGIPYVGLTPDQLRYLAEKAHHGQVNKVSRRDIGYTMANGINGGTTIASTMILSHMAGIKVFATGGLGGVHKLGNETFDVSADLTELGKTPVSVVCAGPKSILDIGLTMEYLETQGVFVSTFNDNNRDNIEVPGFYCRESGVKSPYSFSNFKSIASTIHLQNNIMGLNSGNVICIPPPEKSALDSQFINSIIEEANNEATKIGIRGKELTPFLLGKISSLTKGRSVECNIDFVLNNAKAATLIAKELLQLENGGNVSASVPLTPVNTQSPVETDSCDIIVVGSLALDTTVSIGNQLKMKDSNPGHIRSSIGGVGHNVTMASHYGLKSKFCNSSKKTRLVSVVGDDFEGNSILNQLKSAAIDTLGILITPGSTAQYVSNHSANGELIVACADMAIIEQDFAQHIINQIEKSQPESIVLDCNVSPKVATKVMAALHGRNVNVIIEPTSFAKASRIGEIEGQVFPNNTIDLITPTVAELSAIYESFAKQEKFDDLDTWFPVIESLGLTSQFRERLNTLCTRPQYAVLADLLTQGVLQQAFQLAPYLPNILIKLGEKGVLLVSISTSVSDYKSIPTTSPYKPQFILTSQGRPIDGGQLGLTIKYFPIPEENVDLKIVNVTGAGDALVGYLTACILAGPNWLVPQLESVEQEWYQWESIYKAQLASGIVLKSDGATTSNIALVE